MDYNSQSVEQKWKQYWKDNHIYKVDNDSDKPKYYVLDMFPYPSGAGLHVGHPLGYIASDIYARYKRLNGFNVLHPMGFDAFGLPAETYALESGTPPDVSTKENMVRYREQLSNLGFSFDWSREIYTSDPNYYKWTQWIFTQMFAHCYNNDTQKAMPIADLVAHFEKNGNSGINVASAQEENFTAAEWNSWTAKEKSDVLMNYRLAYRKIGYVNWCEELGTVLANDQVKDGRSERGNHPVIQKAMTQWSLRTTAYAERLLNDLDTLDWSHALKTMQSNWIGRSEGAMIFFDIDGHDDQIEVFTTRPDTIFGATYMVLAPKHELVSKITTAEQKAEIEKYIAYVSTRSEIERMAEKTVSGAFTGAYAINPFTNTKIPVWIGEYVLADYGTGAIMAVPADDERDERFAQKFDLPIIKVIDKTMYPDATMADKLGKMVNSDFLDGMEVVDAIKAVNEEIEKRGIGQKRINYKLRDANFSRQRFWGEPFPVKFDKDGIPQMVDLENLPVELPETNDYKPSSDGKSPLARVTDWVNTSDGFTRETDTMPAVAGSSWYYLRYMDPKNNEALASPNAINYWQDVDLYVGGSEHAVAHLLYARLWHKFLYDKGIVPTIEPFKKLVNQGMIQGVIEFIHVVKEKENGISRFICTGLKNTKYADIETVKMPVHIDFVKEYGSNDSYLDIDGLKRFIAWRPDYENAIFECGNGIYQNGAFTAANGEKESHLITESEVGKMSKSKYNVINPDDVINRYGADCFRLYEMFLGPIDQAKPWDTNGIDGVSKFIRKYWSLFYDKNENWNVSDAEPTKEEFKILHKCIKKVSEDIERFAFNTCVSSFMVAINDLKKANCNKKAILEKITVLLAPFAPFITEELWNKMGNHDTVKSIHQAEFPSFDESYLQESSFEYPICINGKKRATMSFDVNAAKEDMEKDALAMEAIQKWTEGKTVRKIIVVPKRMINIVVG